jgi:hypothetical protein
LGILLIDLAAGMPKEEAAQPGGLVFYGKKSAIIADRAAAAGEPNLGLVGEVSSRLAE